MCKVGIISIIKYIMYKYISKKYLIELIYKILYKSIEIKIL